MTSPLQSTTRIQCEARVLEAQVHDQLVLMHSERGDYYGLNPVATSVWHCLAPEASLAELYARLAQEYDADIETIERDVRPLLEQLITNGLIHVRD